MDEFCPALCEWTAQQLRKLKPADLARLLAYYETHGGPMRPLVQAEQLLRELTSTPQQHANR